MKPSRNNYAFIDGWKMKKAAVRDFFHQLLPAHLLILNFTNGIGGWGAVSENPKSASISKSTAITILESKPRT